ncbi:hypothetical protein [Flavobacterium sp. ZT3R18]|uniref:hypothetical protein n=1 Tax=Flavobacterium sp. ZT3R18 TaxID=2594429 RepID=UPI00163DAE28|nr:hypothetical protein [Flavobacterium sp. ZT3R18]
MLKNLLNLKGARKLTSAEQKTINGGAWKYSDATGYCVTSNSCGGIYSKSYGNGWCCEK